MTIQRIDWAHRYLASSSALSVTANSVTETVTVDLSASNDWWSGDVGGSDDLVDAVATAIATHSEIASCTGAVSKVTFRCVFTCNVDFQLNWTDSATTQPAAALGFDTDADAASSSSVVTSPRRVAGVWLPGRQPSVDTRDRVAVLGGTATSLTGGSRTSYFGESLAERDLRWVRIPRTLALIEYADADAPYSTYEYAWRNGIGRGRVIRLYDDPAATSTAQIAGTYQIRESAQGQAHLVRNDVYDFTFDAILSVRRTA